MNILVCISIVPDTTTKIKFKNNNSEFDKENVQYIINPYDELSLSKALEIIEAKGGEITIINVGLAENDAVIRKALAIGAHKAARIDTEALDANQVAEEIVLYAKEKSFDIIFTGRESIDFNSGAVGPLLAGHLNLPLANIVTEIDIDGTKLKASRDIEGGKQIVEMNLPAVVSSQKNLCEPRIPNMRGIMQARTKPLEILSSKNASNITVSYNNFSLPEEKAKVKMIDAENAEELIDLLRNEKKVI